MLDATCLSRSNAEQQPDGVAAEADGLDGENASGLAGAYRGGGSFSARAAGSHGLSAHLAFGSRWPQGPPSVTAEGGSRARLPTSFGSPPRGVAMTASFSSPPAGITLAQRSPLRANVENQQQHNHNHQQQQQHARHHPRHHHCACRMGTAENASQIGEGRGLVMSSGERKSLLRGLRVWGV